MYKIQGGTNIKPLVATILMRGFRLSVGNKNLINENYITISKEAAPKAAPKIRKKMNGGGSAEFFE